MKLDRKTAISALIWRALKTYKPDRGMSSFRVHKQNLQRMLNMLEKGRFISRRHAARLFECTEGTITIWLNELREDGHDIHYSRSLQKYVLNKNERKK